jgi:sugar-specific transcriptional regulator TrmB
MEYKVTIYEKGKPRVRTLFIERVPYKVFEIAQRLERMTQETRQNVETMQAIEKESAELREKRPDGWKDKIKENASEIKDLADRIYAVEDAGFFKDRFEAIKIILSVNGIKDDDELMNESTWADKMDFADPMAFITSALQKDIDKKKLLTAVLRSTSGD